MSTLPTSCWQRAVQLGDRSICISSRRSAPAKVSSLAIVRLDATNFGERFAVQVRLSACRSGVTPDRHAAVSSNTAASGACQ